MGKIRRKDAKQEEERRARKAEFKARRSKIKEEPTLVRPLGIEKSPKKILIISEGVNTEPTYFRHFKLPNIIIEPIGIGLSTTRLVEEADSLLRNKYQGKKFDEIWLVFDKDDNDDFENAIKLALSKKYRVAYSNQAVEYWFILHFYDHHGEQLSRDSYEGMINRYIEPLGAKYDDSKIVSNEFFEILMSRNPETKKYRYQEAFDRAERILSGDPGKTKESVTMVHKLFCSIIPLETTKDKRIRAKKEESKKKAGIK
ncbi:MAG: RloB family protein [Clostridia bacterium]|nr:RloB family protein [Clostridia bacterium]